MKKGLEHGAVAGMDSYQLAKDAYFMDGDNNKYTALKDDQGNYIAAKHSNFAISIKLGPKQTVTTWAKFPAPPAEVNTVRIYLPGAPPFEDITIK